MKDYHKILTDFYQKHNPEKLGQVDYLLNKYKGREEELVKSLKEKYGVTADESTPVEEPEPTKEKISKPKRQPKKKEKAEKEDSKKDWEKKREEILRKVKERAEQLKKEREAKAKKEPVTKVPPPVEHPKEPETEEVETENEITVTNNSKKKKTESVTTEPTAEPKVETHSNEEVKEEIQEEEPIKEEAKQETQDKEQEEAPKEESKTQARKSTLPAVRKNKESIEETYSVKGLMIGLAVVFSIMIAFFVFNPRQRDTVLSQLGFGEGQGTSQESTAPKKKSGIDPQMIESKDSHEEETEPVAEEESSGNFQSELDEDESEPNLLDEDKTTEQDEPAPPQKASGLSGYVIGYSAVARENTATSQASDLIGKGFKAGYYWIPDYSPGGSQLYKVYVGPYATEYEAGQALPDIRKINPQAYVMLLK